MLKRKVYSELLEWKNREHKCLVITGQRQVGKTFIIELFGKNEYKTFIEINLNDDREAKDIFKGPLNVDSIIKNIIVKYDIKDIDPKDTLLFFDEIQECPEAYSSLKAFTIDGRYDVIASGSLLGVNIPNVSKPGPLIPMGYEERIIMHGLDFEEFIIACGVDESLIEEIRGNFVRKERINEIAKKKLESLFRDYMIVGGMPESVQAFINDGNYKNTSKILSDLVNSCIRDINRYNEGLDKVKTSDCFDSIKDQLSESNKKYIYSRINGGKSRKAADIYKENLLWIKGAGYGNFCYNVNEIVSPLRSIRDSFKIYLSDTGMLINQYGTECMKAIYNDDTGYNKGAIAENVAAECLMKCGYQLRYYNKNSGEGKMEIDFIVETDSGITAIEIKSGKDRSAPSLNKIDRYWKVGRKMMFEKSNIHADDDGIEHYPMFCIAFMDSLRTEWFGEDAGAVLNLQNTK